METIHNAVNSVVLASYLNLMFLLVLKITCFIVGYKIIKLGYMLVDKGVRGEFKFSAEYEGKKADLVSASPGLLFLVLGVAVIIYAMAVSKPVKLGISAEASAHQEQKELKKDDLFSGGQ